MNEMHQQLKQRRQALAAAEPANLDSGLRRSDGGGTGVTEAVPAQQFTPTVASRCRRLRCNWKLRAHSISPSSRRRPGSRNVVMMQHQPKQRIQAFVAAEPANMDSGLHRSDGGGTGVTGGGTGVTGGVRGIESYDVNHI